MKCYRNLLLFFFFSLISVALYSQSADSLRMVNFSSKAKALKAAYQIEEAVVWYKKAIVLQKKLLGEESLELAKSYNNLGLCWQELGNYNFAIENYYKSLKIKQKHFKEQPNSLAITYLNLGVAYRVKNYLNKALDNYQKALDIRLALYGSDSLQVANVYENIAIVYELKGDYDKAITYYEKSLPVQINLLDEYDVDLGYSYSNIAGCLTAQNKISEALTYYQKALKIQENQVVLSLAPVADVYNNMGLCYQKDRQFDQALAMFEKSLVLRKKIYRPYHKHIGYSYEGLAQCYADKKDYKNALVYDKKLIDLILNSSSPSSIDLASAYQKIGQTYSNLGDYQQGLSFQDKAWNAFFSDVGTSNNKSVTQEQFDNQVEKALNNPLIYHSILSGKARILWQTYKNTQDPSYLFPALLSYRQATEFIDKLRLSYAENASKQLLVEKVYEDYENAISICYELYQKNNQLRFLQEAFTFSEKSKSVLLLEAVNTIQAEDFSGIPDSLIEQEKELRADIAHLEQQKFLALQEKKDPNEAKIVDFNRQLFDLKQAQANLLHQFENNYEKYYSLKYDVTTSSLETIQALLRPEQTMVAYFLGDSSLFTFVISTNAVQFLKLEQNLPIKDLVQDVLMGMYNYQLVKSINEKYIAAAHTLYQKLWEKVVPPTAKEIIVIPNGELGVLPFEVLLKTLPKEVNYFGSYDYLIKDYQISYNYSATLFKKLSDNPSFDKIHNFLAFAPTFTQTTPVALAGQAQRGFDQLKYNKSEVENIAKILNIDKKVFLAEDATKVNLLKYIEAYSLVHLATHGIVNDEFGDYSYLALADENGQEDLGNKLYVKELYSLSLQADMVVLSACETGVGELKKGEGMISLARGFFYAGTKSIVTTLWKISDKSSSKIIKQFYANLNQQMPKDAALREAKLDYISNQPNKLAHPFYWAAYIPVGNMESLNLHPFSPLVPILCGLFLFFALGAFYFFKMNHK